MKLKGSAIIIQIACVLGWLLPLFRLEFPGPLALFSPEIAAETAPSSVMFVENVGQFPDGVRFQAQAANGTLWVTDGSLWLTTVEADGDGSGVNLKLTFLGGSQLSSVEPFDRLETTVSFFKGDDPRKWRPAVPAWGGVRYAGFIPGADLVLTGEKDRWVWRLACDGGDCASALRDLRLRVEGADCVTLGSLGLEITAESASFTLPLLEVTGRMPGGQPSVISREPGVFDLAFPFSRAPFLSALPQSDNAGDLLYSTFLGGNNADYGNGLAVDDSGAAYITGRTESTNFPTTPGAFDTTYNSIDAFLVKIAPGGGSLVYATFLGGSVTDEATGLAIDKNGAAFVTGYTFSTDFPITSSAFDTSYNGSRDAFVVKVAPDGNALSYGTYLGGSGMWDQATGIAVDDSGSAYIIGMTYSSDFPTSPGTFDTSYNGQDDTFLTKLAPDGSALDFSTYLGGSGSDIGGSIAVDGGGTAYITGTTSSANFPTTPGAFDASYNGSQDAYVSKVAPNGNALTYSTYLGGSADDQPRAVAVDQSGAAFITGSTDSTGFPTSPGAFDTSHNGGRDAFVSKIAPGGSLLDYSTFLGESGTDTGRGLAVDGSGVAYVVGGTDSASFPVTPDGYDTSHNGNNDVFLLKLASDGSSLVYSSFLGGGSSDYGLSVVLDGSGTVYITGRTESSAFPTTPGAYDLTFGGSICGVSPTYPCPDAFVARAAMGSGPTPPTIFSYLPLVTRP